jgi:DNA-binding NtrC family response regulator
MTTLPMPPHSSDHVLVASPNSLVRERVLENLRRRTARVEQAAGGAEALVQLEKGSWQILFLDRCLPDLNAEELSRTVRQLYPAMEVVLLDDEGAAAESIPEAPECLLDGPHLCGRSSLAQESVEKRDPLGWHEKDKTKASDLNVGSPAAVLPGMIGRSAKMQSVYQMAQLVAPRDTTVLIVGPTGSGKELVARAVHQLSARAGHTFAVVNCAAIPETMLEAELFGYSRGAFTGALQSYAGRIHAAHQGTLFLDEIGDMPLSLQPKLLRFLEQKELQRLGSSQVVHVDARVISATNADLLTLVREGKFREDLYYRLSAFPLVIPPLRDRREDVLQLAEYFLQKFCPGPLVPIFSEEARGLLLAENWPGNARELQNVIERALILANHQPVIAAGHLMLPDMGSGTYSYPAER